MKSIFTSQKCEFVFSPTNQKWLRALQKRVPHRANHLWLLSSGTSRAGSIKAIAHTKEGFLEAAKASNQHLNSTRTDVWLNVLPTYHVGGLAIHARAFLSGAKVVEPHLPKWNPSRYVQALEKSRATLTSLVPTQVFDLVRANLPAPNLLRAVVVGGGSLSPELYRKARDLEWPLLPSYGLTECGSQVATASLESLKHSEFPLLQPLSHVSLKALEDRLHIRSSAICDWIGKLDMDGQFSLEIAAPSGWFQTDDIVELTSHGLAMRARAGDFVKVLGVLVNLSDLERRIESRAEKLKLRGRVAVISTPDQRRGNSLILVTDSKNSLKAWSRLIQKLNVNVQGPERIQNLAWTSEIPQTDLGKIKKAELRQKLSF